jgi:phosphatidate phosphatase APP1
VRERPGRVRAVYIRDVTDPAGDRRVHRIADEVERLGVPMRLVERSETAARHAAEFGLIPTSAVDEVAAASVEEEQKDDTWWERLLK